MNWEIFAKHAVTGQIRKVTMSEMRPSKASGNLTSRISGFLDDDSVESGRLIIGGNVTVCKAKTPLTDEERKARQVERAVADPEVVAAVLRAQGLASKGKAKVTRKR